MDIPSLVDVFTKICTRDNGALLWGYPEEWVHAELYALFNAQAKSSGWIPFREEVPYVTRYPVVLPKPSNRDWKSAGAVKWVDLCLRSTKGNSWLWLECKARHADWSGLDRKKASKGALDAYRKDVVALLGFDVRATADTWENPDGYTRAYWFEPVLKPYAKDLLPGTHHFFSAFLQLGGHLDEDFWSEEKIIQQVNSWKAGRCKERGEVFCEVRNLTLSSQAIGNHWLVLSQSTEEASSGQDLVSRFSEANRSKVARLLALWREQPQAKADKGEVEILFRRGGRSTLFRACPYKVDHLILTGYVSQKARNAILSRFSGDRLPGGSVSVPLAKIEVHELPEFLNMIAGLD